jgi:pantoate--beta-alanine ligase
MELLPDKSSLRDWIAYHRNRPRVLVPTMGALHRGHTSLFDRAREEASRLGGEVVATIFVNPTQFGPNEDFTAYPRPLEADLAKCREHGVDAVFAPGVGDMYADDRSITIAENRLSTTLCGASRPGHFDGVCTVVAKLFLLTQPGAAIFGEKDFQQLAVIRRLVRDLDFPVDIIGAPTVREEDGLALSSRNVYLTPGQRAQAQVLQRSLAKTARGIAEGRLETPGAAREAFLGEFAAATLARLDYFEMVDAWTLQRLDEFGDSEPRLLAAAFFGKTRLIDNVGLS